MDFRNAMISASPFLLGLGSDLSGRTRGAANLGAVAMQKMAEEKQRKEAISGLMGDLGIAGPQAALLDTMPAEMQQRYLMDRMQQQEAERRQRAAAGAAQARAAAEQRAIQDQWRAMMGGAPAGQAPVAPQMQPAAPLSFGEAAPQQGVQGQPNLSFGNIAQPPAVAKPVVGPYERYKAAYERALMMPPGAVNPQVVDRLGKLMEVHKPAEPKAAKIQELADGRYYYVDETGQTPPRLVNPDVVPKADLSEREAKIRDLMEFNNLTREQASAVANGLVRAVPDGLGGVELVDVRDAFNAGDQSATDAGDSGVAAVPEVDYGAALGLIGDAKNVANVVGDYLLGERAFEDVGQARTGLKNLRTRTLTTLASAGVAGRPSNYLMEMFNENVVTPGLLSGRAGARDTAIQTLQFIDSMIAENEAVRTSRVGRTMKAEAARNIEALSGLKKDYERVVGGLSPSSGVAIRPEVEDRLKAYE